MLRRRVDNVVTHMQRFRLAPLPEQHIPPEAWSDPGTENSQAVTLTYQDGKPLVSATGEDTPPDSPPWRHKSEGGTIAEAPPGGFTLPQRMQNLSSTNGSMNNGNSDMNRSLTKGDSGKGSGALLSTPSTPSKTSTTAISNKAVAAALNGHGDGINTQVACLSMHTHAHVHAHTHTHLHINLRVWAYTCIHTHIDTYLHKMTSWTAMTRVSAHMYVQLPCLHADFFSMHKSLFFSMYIFSDFFSLSAYLFACALWKKKNLVSCACIIVCLWKNLQACTVVARTCTCIYGDFCAFSFLFCFWGLYSYVSWLTVIV